MSTTLNDRLTDWLIYVTSRSRRALIRLTHDGQNTGHSDNDVGSFPAGRSVLLYGPPGCGKLSLSRWFAAECRSRLVQVNCRLTSGHLSEYLAAALDR